MKNNWKMGSIIASGVIAVIVLCIFGVQSSQNKAFVLEESVDSAKSDISVQEQRRVDLVYNLADCVKQYDKHEAETLKAIVDGRGSTGDIKNVTTAITAVSEAYPELKSNENDMYNKAIHIESTDIFQYGMNTNVGNAFVYGDLKAVDTVAYPEIGGKYIYVKKVEERCEKHEREVTKTDSEGKKYTETEEYYRWDTYDSESLQSEKVSFLGIVFPCAKINLPSADYINTINGGKTYSWKSGEYVKVKFVYYGVGTEFTGTIFTDLRDGTISDKTNFYNGLSIDDTINRLETNGKIGIVLF